MIPSVPIGLFALKNPFNILLSEKENNIAYKNLKPSFLSIHQNKIKDVIIPIVCPPKFVTIEKNTSKNGLENCCINLITSIKMLLSKILLTRRLYIFKPRKYKGFSIQVIPLTKTLKVSIITTLKLPGKDEG